MYHQKACIPLSSFIHLHLFSDEYCFDSNGKSSYHHTRNHHLYLQKITDIPQKQVFCLKDFVDQKYMERDPEIGLISRQPILSTRKCDMTRGMKCNQLWLSVNTPMFSNSLQGTVVLQ